MHHYWVSSNKGTCWVYVDDKGIIRDCAALWKRFRTQSFSNLVKWLGDAKVVEINKKEGEMNTPRSKYYNDPHYHQLVDVMVGMIMKAQYTPSEMREAAILASIIYQEMQPSTCVMPREVIDWLEKAEGIRK